MSRLGVGAGVAGVVDDLRRDGPGWLLVFVSLGWFLALGVRIVYPALLPRITAEFEVTHRTAGLFLGTLWTTYALFQFPGGVLADAVGERIVLTGSLLLAAVVVGALALSPTLWPFVAATVFLGVGTGLYGTTRITVLSATYDRMETTAISVSQSAGNVGNVVLPASAGAVGAYLGWRGGFGILLPLLLVSAAGIWFVLPSRSDEESGDDAVGETMVTLAAELRTPQVIAVTGLLALNMLLYQSVTGFLPTYLTDVKGLAPSTAATLFSLFFASAIGLQFASGVIADRFGNRPAIALFLGLSVPAFVLLTVAETVPALVGTVLLLSCMLGGMPPVNAAGVGALPAEVRGSGFGLLRTVYIAVGAAGPPAVGQLADYGLFDEAFLLLGGVALCTSVWGYAFRRVASGW
jgi:predicted MFS family arabinose efflux permease